MLIRIQYQDGRYDMVKPFQLDRLLSEQRLSGFMRNNVWTRIGHDPLRHQGVRPARYTGTERRLS